MNTQPAELDTDYANFLATLTPEKVERERFRPPGASERPGSRRDREAKAQHNKRVALYWELRHQREAVWRLYQVTKESHYYDKKVDKRSD
jgi:hypothetical protein